MEGRVVFERTSGYTRRAIEIYIGTPSSISYLLCHRLSHSL